MGTRDAAHLFKPEGEPKQWLHSFPSRRLFSGHRSPVAMARPKVTTHAILPPERRFNLEILVVMHAFFVLALLYKGWPVTSRGRARAVEEEGEGKRAVE